MSTHNTEQTPYEQQVRRIAQILAGPLSNLFNDDDRPANLSEEQEVIEAAKLMVAEMAKQYEHAYFSNYHGDEESEEYETWNQNCIYEMQERGLIPTTKTDENG